MSDQALKHPFKTRYGDQAYTERVCVLLQDGVHMYDASSNEEDELEYIEVMDFGACYAVNDNWEEFIIEIRGASDWYFKSSETDTNREWIEALKKVIPVGWEEEEVEKCVGYLQIDNVRLFCKLNESILRGYPHEQSSKPVVEVNMVGARLEDSKGELTIIRVNQPLFVACEISEDEEGPDLKTWKEAIKTSIAENEVQLAPSRGRSSSAVPAVDSSSIGKKKVRRRSASTAQAPKSGRRRTISLGRSGRARSGSLTTKLFKKKFSKSAEMLTATK